MCDNEVAIDFKADGIKDKFLKKSRKETDIDAGMIDESIEQREAMQSGAYSGNNDTDGFGNGGNDQGYDNHDVESRKHTISAYDDDGIRGHGPSAGSWQDVEED
eukprot:CAMPEP_0201568734 /NCGR_PEP_ID=MMETSP0190_2-20130828/9961_1 /ASSEMBLY_ACC=CAM_ASM_000263 /TAXON_ID=37353 /ORGANISM="Rosalina sp." /LENGTH=103 /DNA_ID=CAMNT_0047990183 /DNA_START=601 /DNA_END=912 /DNA_ORIENTATION=-